MVMALTTPIVAMAWAKVDDILSTPTFSSLECVYLLDDHKLPVQTRAHPHAVHILQQVFTQSQGQENWQCRDTGNEM